MNMNDKDRFSAKWRAKYDRPLPMMPKTTMMPMMPIGRKSATRPTSDQCRLLDIELPAKLGARERGAIILPNVQINSDGPNLSLSSGGFEPQTVRNALLLFDHLVQPDNNAISVGGELVEECGNIENVHRSFARFEGTLGPDVIRTTAGETFTRLDAREPGLWSIIRAEGENVFPEGLLKAAPALRLKLENALPFPDREVSIEDVLAFKQRRSSELSALRLYIDELVLEAQRNGFEGLSETHAVERLLGALDDYNRSMREQNFLKRMTDVEISFNWTALPAAGLVLWLQGLTIPALATAAALSSISLTSSVGLKTSSGQPSPLEYLFRSTHEM